MNYPQKHTLPAIGESSRPMVPVIYVCLLSQYTIATAQAIKNVMPERVIAVSSDYVRNNGWENRFVDLVESWGIRVDVLGNSRIGEPFIPGSLNGSVVWMERNVRPKLENLQSDGRRFFANLTGATKAASIALDKLWDWDERHYTAEGTRSCINVVGHPSGEEDFSLPPLEFIEEFDLLNDEVRPKKDAWEQFDPVKLNRAVDHIYNDYLRGETDSVLYKNKDALYAAWFKFPKDSYEKTLADERIETSKKYVRFPKGALSDFLVEFSSLDPEHVVHDGAMLRLPADKKVPVVDLIIGKWWEILVAQWFRDRACSVACNVEIKRPRTHMADTESDILIRSDDGALAVVECKVALPGSRGAIDIVKILNDVSKQFGKSKGVLALSPAFWWNFTDIQQENFKEACELRHVRIVTKPEDIGACFPRTSKQGSLPPYRVYTENSDWSLNDTSNPLAS